MKKLLFITIGLFILMCFTSCKSCKKDDETVDNTSSFEKLVNIIYESETKLTKYIEEIKMSDNDLMIYFKNTDFSLERKEQTKTNVTTIEKKLSTSGTTLYDEVVSSYTTIDNKKYVVLNGTTYETEYVMPTYYLTFVLSTEFLEEGYTLEVDENNYTLRAKVLGNKASSLFLNKSVGNITNLEIEIIIQNNLLKKFNASYISANNFKVNISTNYFYPANE